MVPVEDVLLFVAILRQDDLLSPEEGPVLLIEVHLLLVAQTGMRDPQTLGVGLHLEIEQSNGADQGERNGGDDDDAPVAEVEPGDGLEHLLQLHYVLF